MGWTLFYMMVILKIPLAAALYIVWWAIREVPEADEGLAGEDRGPRRKPLLPRWPRRGPTGTGADCKPPPCPLEQGPSIARRAPAHARR